MSWFSMITAICTVITTILAVWTAWSRSRFYEAAKAKFAESNVTFTVAL